MVAKMSMLRAFICLAASALIFDITAATNFTVGSPPGGWDTTTDLQSWASSQSFIVGDNLIFQYTTNHDVVEVTKANYDSCQASNPILLFMGGTTVLPLVATGKRYFICGTSGHCAQGMKVEIDTLATATPAPPPGSPPVTPPASSPPSSATTPPPPAGGPPSSPGPPRSVSSPPPPPSSATKVKLMVGSTVGLGFVSMMLLAL